MWNQQTWHYGYRDKVYLIVNFVPLKFFTTIDTIDFITIDTVLIPELVKDKTKSK